MRSELWLVRHGETEWSAAGRHTGHTDIPLTETGRVAAQQLRARLAGTTFVRVLTSPLARARETCALAGFGDISESVPDLREWDYGDDEGLTTAAIREQRPGWTVWNGPQGGESVEAIGLRADRLIADVLRSEGRVLAFSHGHLSRVLGARWIGLAATHGAHLRLDTAAICILGWERETPVLKLWNDTAGSPA